MRKIITIFLLLLHVNTSMFIPVLKDRNVFTEAAVQVDDINISYSYADPVLPAEEGPLREHRHRHHAHEFYLVHIKAFVIPQLVISDLKKETLVTWVNKPDYKLAPEYTWTSVVNDITGPPPKA